MTRPHLDFDDADREQLASRGIAVAEARRQLQLLRRPPAPIRLDRPAAVGDGIVRIGDADVPELLRLHDEAAGTGRLLKFVPASGAATRMFQDLLADPPAKDAARRLVDNLPRFAFHEDLRRLLEGKGQSLGEIVDALLTPAGLGYASIPKGLVKFHRYASGSRTPIEEHLVEAATLVRDAAGVSRVHFTVSPDDAPRIAAYVEEVRPAHERDLGASFAVSFSVQSPSTETIALDGDGALLRDERGALVLRPGGHGSLLENLDALGGDLVHVKNIDNVTVEPRQTTGLLWRRILVGYLVRQERDLSDHRPLRVCGVVRNTGEPGGGPFWVRDEDGRSSLQIVETAEVDAGSAEQREILRRSTHFNPVDLVCGVRDPSGRPYDLRRHANENAVVLARKTWRGREILALERPGLWNGGMADWNTVFVEIPGEAFTPVKTVFDLLRAEHQVQGDC